MKDLEKTKELLYEALLEVHERQQEVFTGGGFSFDKSVAYTEMLTLLDCPAKHDYRYEGVRLGEALKPKQMANQDKINAGKSWEVLIEAWARGMPYDSIIENATYEHGAIFDHLWYIYKGECPVSVDDSQGFVFLHGIFSFYDGLSYLGRDKEGIHWWDLVEFKFLSKLRTYEELKRDRQLRWYLVSFEENMKGSHKIHGLHYFEVLNKAYEGVKVNKNGSLSKRQNCFSYEYENARDTTPGWDQEVFEGLQKKESHKKTSFYLSPEEKLAAYEEMYDASMMASYTRPTYPNPNPMRCRMCEFDSICTENSSTKKMLAQSLVDNGIMERHDKSKNRASELPKVVWKLS